MNDDQRGQQTTARSDGSSDIPRLASPTNTPRKPGRPSSVNREDIAAAVVRVGFPTASFATVAEELGIAPATLYRHVADRTELVRLGLERIVTNAVWPEPTGTWAEQLSAWATASWHLWEQHPGAVRELLSGAIPPTIPALANKVSLILTGAGFTVANAVLAVDLVMDLAADSRLNIELLHLDPNAENATIGDALFETWDRAARDSSDPEARLPDVGAAMLAAMSAPPITWFESKLAVVLAGIDTALAPRSTPS